MRSSRSRPLRHSRHTPSRGISSAHRSRWKAIYEEMPYHDLPWYNPDPSPQVERAVAAGFFPRGAAVLDVGCGAGSNVIFLASKGFEAHGIDLSPGAIRAATSRARSAGLSMDLRVGDVLALDFPTARFDGLIDNGCFHTLPIRRRADYAREVARVLRPGGAFVLSWVAREHVAERGPPHRPSLAEVAEVLEGRFLFERTGFHRPATRGHATVYDAWLTRRTTPPPPTR